MTKKNKQKKSLLTKNHNVKIILISLITVLLISNFFSTIVYANNNDFIIVTKESTSDIKQNIENTANEFITPANTSNEPINNTSKISNISRINQNKDYKYYFMNSAFSFKEKFYNMLKNFMDRFPRLYNISFLVKLLDRLNRSNESEDNNDYNPPSKVDGLKISNAGSGKLYLAWDSAEDDNVVEGYNVYENNVLSASVVTTSYMVSGLQNDQVYSYQISAVDSSGNEGDKSSSSSAAPSENSSDDIPDVFPDAGHIAIIAQGEMQLDTTLNIDNNILITLRGSLYMDTNMESLDIWWNLSTGYFKINATTSSSDENQHFKLENFLIEIKEIGGADSQKLSFSIGYIDIYANGHFIVMNQGNEGSLNLVGMISFNDVHISAENFVYEDFTFAASIDVSVGLFGGISLSWNESGLRIPGDDSQLGAGFHVSVEDLLFESPSFGKVTADQIIISAGGYVFIGDTIEAEFAGGLYIQSLSATITQKGSVLKASLKSLSLTGMGFVELTNDSVMIEASADLSLEMLLVESSEIYVGSLLLSGAAVVHIDLETQYTLISTAGSANIDTIFLGSNRIDSVSAGANLVLTMGGRNSGIDAEGFLDVRGIYFYKFMGFTLSLTGLHASGDVSYNLNTGEIGFSAGISLIGLHMCSPYSVDADYIGFGGSGYLSMSGGIEASVSGSLVVSNILVASGGNNVQISSLNLYTSHATIDMGGGNINVRGAGFRMENTQIQIGSITISCALFSLSASAEVTLGSELSIDSDGGGIAGTIQNLNINGFGGALGTSFSIVSISISGSAGIDFTYNNGGLVITANGGVTISSVYLIIGEETIKAHSIDIGASFSISASVSTVTFDSSGTSVIVRGLFVSALGGGIGLISLDLAGSLSLTGGEPLQIGCSGSATLNIKNVDFSFNGDIEIQIYASSAILSFDFSYIHITGSVNSFTTFSMIGGDKTFVAELESGQIELEIDASNINFNDLSQGSFSISATANIRNIEINSFSISNINVDADISAEWDVNGDGVGSIYANGNADLTISFPNNEWYILIQGHLDASWDIDGDYDGSISLDAFTANGKIVWARPNFAIEIAGDIDASGDLAWDYNPEGGIDILPDSSHDFSTNFYIRFKLSTSQWIQIWPTGGSSLFASFTWNPTSPVADETVTFDASSSYNPGGNGLEYQWDFGDESSTSWSENPVIDHIYETQGSYNVTLTIREKTAINPKSDSSSKNIRLGDGTPNQPPVAAFSMTPDPIINHVHEDEDIIFDASNSYDPDGEIVDYNWNFGDGSTISGEDAVVVNHNYSNDGDYTATLTVTDDDGDKDSISKSFHIYAQDPANTPPEAYQYVLEYVPDYGTSHYIGQTSANGQTTVEGKTSDYTYTFEAYRPYGMSGGDTHDRDGYIRRYRWDWQTPSGTETTGWININEDDQIPDKGPLSWNSPGEYSVTLSVEDNEYAISSCTININIQLTEGPFILSNPQVDPIHKPDTSGDFTYSVVYTDGDGDIPISNSITINGNEYNSLSHDGQSVTAGRTYYKVISADASILTDNDNSFYFTFTNGPDGTKTTDTISGPYIGIHPPHAAIGINAPDGFFTDKEIIFSSSGSYDSDGDDLQYRWDYNNNGEWDTNWIDHYQSLHVYELPGQYTVKLEVREETEDGLTDTVTKMFTITLEESEPEVRTMPASDIDESSATLRGRLEKDGSHDCNVWFKYKKSTAIFWRTAQVSGTYRTGDSFSADLNDLDEDTTYLFKAYAENIIGTEEGETLEFTPSNNPHSSPISISVSKNPSGDVDVGDTITFTGTASGGTEPYNWDWSFGDGGSASDTGSSSTITHEYMSSGDYTISVLVIDDNGDYGEANIDVHVDGNAPPVAITDGPYYAGVDQMVYFYGGDSYDPDSLGMPFNGITWFHWDFGDGRIAEGSDSTGGQLTYSQVGDYTITLTVTNNDDMTHTTSTVAHIGTLSPPVSNPSCSPTTQNIGKTITFDGSNSYDTDGSIDWSQSYWDFSDDGTGDIDAYGMTVSKKFYQTGIFRAYLTVVDNDGLEDQNDDYCVFQIEENEEYPTVQSSTYSIQSTQATLRGKLVDDGGSDADCYIRLARQSCFLNGTKIIMSDDTLKNIEDVKIGEYVKSYDEKTNKIVNGKVGHIFVHTKDIMEDFYLVINNKLRVTAEHPIYRNGEWIKAEDLKIGDKLKTYNKESFVISSIDRIYEKEVTYNIYVEDYNTYFADEILAHNKPGPVWKYCGTHNTNWGSKTFSETFYVSPGATYEWYAYATNSHGTGYGSTKTFTVPSSSS